MAKIDRNKPIPGGGYRTAGINKITYRARMIILSEESENKRIFYETMPIDLKEKMEKEISLLKKPISCGIVPSLISIAFYNQQVDEIENKYKVIYEKNSSNKH